MEKTSPTSATSAEVALAPGIPSPRAGFSVSLGGSGLFSEMSYYEVSLEAVARRAGVSLPTVLRKFGSKDALFAECARAASERESEARTVTPRDVRGAARVLALRYEQLLPVWKRHLDLEGRFPAVAQVIARARQPKGPTPRKAALVICLLLSLGVVLAACTARLIRPTTPSVVAATPELLERGSYLVNNVSACGLCHTPRVGSTWLGQERTDAFLAGGSVFHVPEEGFRVVVPNITQDKETQWSEEDLDALVSYLTSLKPIRHEVADRELTYAICDSPHPSALDALPSRLSETGLYDGPANGAIASGVYPFRPQFELFSDGAGKRRARGPRVPAGELRALSQSGEARAHRFEVLRPLQRPGLLAARRYIGLASRDAELPFGRRERDPARRREQEQAPGPRLSSREGPADATSRHRGGGRTGGPPPAQVDRRDAVIEVPIP